MDGSNTPRNIPADFDPFSGPEILGIIPLTPSQTEIWLSCALGGDQANRAYNESNSLRLKGRLNLTAFKQAVEGLVERHESFRASFSGDGKNMLVYQDPPSQYFFHDLSEFSDQEKEEALNKHLLTDAHHVFDLLKGPLYRATLLKMADDEHHFTFTAHHLVIDGWSIGVVMQELGRLYSAYVEGLAPDLPPPDSFSKFASDENRFLESPQYREVENFWLDLYRDKVPVVDLPTDKPRPIPRTYTSSRLDYVLEESLVSGLKKLGISSGCTFVNTLMTAFEVFLYRVTGQEDLVIGLPASGQLFTGNYNLVGHGVNLLPLRSQPKGKMGFGEYLQLRKSAIFDAYENQQLTFGTLLKKLKVLRDPSRIPLVPVVFNVDIGMEEGVGFHQLEFEMISNPKAYLNFEWSLNANGSEKDIVLEWTYNSHLFGEETMHRMMDGFIKLLKSIVSNPSQPIDKIKVFGDSRVKQLPGLGHVYRATGFPEFRPVHVLIEQAAVKFSGKTAIFFREEQCSYRELNERANQLAHYLIEKGIRPGDLIGIVMDRSIEMIVGILAALKAGGAYMPIDTDYPAERIRYMLQGSSRMHLTTRGHRDRSGSGQLQILWEDFAGVKDRYPTSNPGVPVRPCDAAYVIYTSGSTGRPKAVVLEHHSLFNFLVTVSETPGISHADRVMAVSSVSFDIAILELLLPFVHGAQSFLLDGDQRKDPWYILERIEAGKATLMFATPSHWKMMLETGWHRPFPGFNAISGGEELSRELAERLLPLSASLWNLYGPTETTVFSTAKKIENLDRPITIGRPVHNTRVYILDDSLQPVREGQEGEIFISGNGVARGYLNRPELTAERFIRDPFQPEGGSMYRTGDLGKFTPDGEIIMLGRKDQQVKLRGHRIEPGEIEHALVRLEGVKDAAVAVREDSPGNPRLVAYLTLSADGGKHRDGDGPPPWERQWRRQLSLSLPDYMVPGDFVVMENFPLTASGKLDRKALPRPANRPPDGRSEHLSPGTPEERLVEQIWSEALGISNLNITDNFFEIGGHSMIAVQVMTRIEKESGIKLPISILFEYPTIQKFAQVLKSKGKSSSWNSLVPIKPQGNKTPLYIVHGGGLNVMPFYSIAKHLEMEQPLYGLQAHGLNGIDKPYSSIEEIAGHYVEEIVAQNPFGTYALAGYSFGGIIAFEMAKQLKNQGKEIKSLIMFDTYAHKNETGLGVLGKIAERIKTEIGKRIFDLQMVKQNPAIFKRVKKVSFQKKLAKAKKQLRIGKAEPETEIMRIIKSIKEVHKAAGKKYVITPYDGEIFLFRAKTRTSYLEDFKYFGWEPFVKKINIIEMEGEHTTMFEPPHEENFVQILQKILNNT